MSSIHIGILADLHVGSAFALWPRGFETSLFGTWNLNQGQEYLLTHWQSIAAQIPALDILLFNGDEVEGKNRKGEGAYVIEPDQYAQGRAAAEIVQPFLKHVKRGGEIYCTQGTKYHEGDGAKVCEQFARDVHAVPMSEGHACWDRLLLDVAGKHLDIAHHQPATLVYRFTTQEREMGWAEQRAVRPDLIVRSHSHAYSWHEVAREGGRLQCFLSTPCWKLNDEFCHTSKNPNRLLNDGLGMVVIAIQNGEIERQRFLFEHPVERRAEYARSRVA